jgi:putative tryptophan/tyrosine transport system substrate-binding protein
MRQVGILYPGPQAAAPSRITSILSELQAGGLPAEQITIVPRITGGDPALLGPMAADLVDRKVDLILAIGPAAVRAARAATSSIPIVAGDLESDPLSSGYIASNRRPGGNVTGVFLDFPDFSKKWLQALMETVPWFVLRCWIKRQPAKSGQPIKRVITRFQLERDLTALGLGRTIPKLGMAVDGGA